MTTHAIRTLLTCYVHSNSSDTSEFFFGGLLNTGVESLCNGREIENCLIEQLFKVFIFNIISISIGHRFDTKSTFVFSHFMIHIFSHQKSMISTAQELIVKDLRRIQILFSKHGVQISEVRLQRLSHGWNLRRYDCGWSRDRDAGGGS